VAETVEVWIDKNYVAPNAFNPEQFMGTISTTNGAASLWDGAPVRVYAGGGEGTVVRDFEIVVTDVPLVTFDLEVVDVVPGGGLVLGWEGAVGQTYRVQYAVDLTAGEGGWLDDNTVGNPIIDNGALNTVTSEVGVANAFYRTVLDE
jgi:hypothetical protein